MIGGSRNAYLDGCYTLGDYQGPLKKSADPVEIRRKSGTGDIVCFFAQPVSLAGKAGRTGFMCARALV